MRVRVNIPEKMAAWVKVGQPLTLSVEAYPDRTFQGKLVRINPSVETQTRTFEAEALVANPDGVLKPGFFVRGTIPSDQIDRVLSLPESALNYAYGGYTVLLISDGKLLQKEVTIGDHIGKDTVEILSGLTQNQQVAVPPKGGKPLREGVAVKIVP
jgi:membrane fusion protein (multidrug efflux system)